MIVNSTSKKEKQRKSERKKTNKRFLVSKKKKEKKKQIFCFKLTNRSKNQFQKTIYPIPPIDEQREHYEG